jgi:hypothetical protein
MEPTQDEFLFTVQQNGIPEDAMYLFAITGSTTTRVLGIAISVFSKESETATESEDISQVLEQVERIYFEFGGDPVIAEVLNRAEYLDFTSNYFYYFQITPIIFDTVLSEVEVPNVRINFFPYIKGQTFYNSDYNAIQNSINDQKRSSFLQIADRNSLTTNPSNLDAILGNFATMAEIPDSNYTSTGWTNARYNGVESTGLEYGGISSAITGITFRASFHQFSVSSVIIRALSPEDKVVKTYLHTGIELSPSFQINPFKLKILSPPPIGIDTGSISYNAYPVNTPIALNNLLIITGSVGSEVVRIIDYDLTNKVLEVQRGVGDTTPKVFATYDIFPIYENRIYELDGNKINSVDLGKLFVASTNKILKLDDFGVVYGEEN